jgi:hypothetical protein
MQSEATGLPRGVSRFFLAWYAEVALTTSSIQHPASSIQHPASSIQHPASSIQHPASSIRILNRGLEQTVP